MHYSLRKIAWIAFVLAIVLLILAGNGAYRTTNRLVESERLVAHTHEVQTVMEDLRSDLFRSSIARQTFIITANQAHLGEYTASTQDVPVEMGRLRQLVRDNPSRNGEIDLLENLVNQYLHMLQRSVDLRVGNMHDQQQQAALGEQISALRQQCADRIQLMRQDESRLLDLRRKASERFHERTRVVLGATLLIAICLVVAEFYLLNLEFRRHERTDRIMRHNRELVNAFFSSSTVGFGILGSDLRYQRINEVLAGMAGLSSSDLLGRSVVEIFGEHAPQAEAVLRNVLRSGQPVLGREITRALPGNPKEIRHWLVNYFPIPDTSKDVIQIGVIALDMTDRKMAEKAIRALSGRLINLQDRERRRIAREIHDSLGQYLAAVKINLQLLCDTGGESIGSLATECSELLDRCIGETRTLSHLLHPPLLDEAGLASATSWFVTGFSKRSGIAVALDLPPDLPRLSNDAEIALFRVIQEGLTNVHRHSQSRSADIRLHAAAGQVKLQVRDYGQGIPQEVLDKMHRDGTYLGVGLAGMRERVRELGGEFEVQSDSSGTTISLSIPIKAAHSEGSPVGDFTLLSQNQDVKS